ncbi:MAG: TonB-dependent receptor [Acidobacteriota bacterium]|nr:TonB-dependent receptor [Acidobacteriota bacterium]
MLKSTCFYLSVLLYTSLAVGQEDICADHLREAEKHYEMGRFEKVAPTLLEDACYPDKFNDDQKRAALALLARATLAMDNLQGARNYLETLMAQFPDFTSRAEDKPIFREWVREIKQAFANRANLYALRNQAKVISVSMVEENAAQAPATIHVVDKETIGARGYRNLSELLEDIPEIEIQRKSVAEFRDYYTFRGVSGNEKFIILLNGFRFNSPTGTPHVIDQNYPLLGVERVEVILGPASALYGADAFGGIVNIITPHGQEGMGNMIDVGFGDFGTQDIGLNARHQLGPMEIHVTGRYYESDEPNFAEEFPDRYSWYHERYLPEGVMRGSPDDETDLIFVPEELRKPYASPTDSSFTHINISSGDFEAGYALTTEAHSTSVHAQPEFALYTEDSIFENRLQTIYAKHQISGKNWGLLSSMWQGTYETRPNSSFVNLFTSYEQGFKYGRNQTFKLEERFQWNIRTGSSLIMGVSYENVTALPKTGDLAAPFTSGQPGEGQAHFYLGTDIKDRDGNDLRLEHRFYNLRYNNLGAYLQLQQDLGRWGNLTAGARYDENSRYGSAFNPRTALVVTPLERMTVKLMYGRSFQAPSPFVTYQQFGTIVGANAEGVETEVQEEIVGLRMTFWNKPNPMLAPEELSSWEFAVSYFLNDQLGISADYFDTKVTDKVENVVCRRPEGDLSDAQKEELSFLDVPIDILQTPKNTGALNSKGGSIWLTGLFDVGEVRLHTRLAWTHVTGDLNGKTLPYMAENTWKAGAEARYEKLEASIGLIHRGRTYHSTLTEDDDTQESNDFCFTDDDPSGSRTPESRTPESNDPFFLADLFVRYKSLFRQGHLDLSTWLKIDNLLDNDHTNVSFGGNDTFPDTPQDPRRLNLGITLVF